MIVAGLRLIGAPVLERDGWLYASAWQEAALSGTAYERSARRAQPEPLRRHALPRTMDLANVTAQL